MLDHHDQIKHGLDFTSMGIWIAALMDIVPHITACLSLVWICIRLWDEPRVREWTGRKEN
jgi:hypothetical protein